MFIGGMALFEWLLQLPLLTTVAPGLASMQPNTAVCFALSGLALWLLRFPGTSTLQARVWPAKLGMAAAAIVAAISTATLAEYLLRVDLRLDTLLFTRTVIAEGSEFHGRMAMATALAFVLLSASLLTIDVEWRGRRPGQGMALGTALIGFIAVLGYVYGGHELYRVGAFSSVAMHTALLFLLLGIGVGCARPNHGLVAVITSDSMGGFMARRLLPVVILLPMFTNWLRVHSQSAGWFPAEFGLAVFSTMFIIIMVSIVWVSAWWLNRADAARQHAEERDIRLAVIVDSSSDAIIGKTLNGIVTEWNRGAEKMFGYSEQEIVGQSVTLLAPTDRHEEIQRNLAQIRLGNMIGHHPAVRCRKDGTILNVALTISPVRNRRGEIVGASTVCHDITQEMRKEEALRESQGQLKGIIDSAMDAVVTVDDRQNVVMFNMAAEKMFQCPAAEAMGQPLETFIPERYRANHRTHVEQFGALGVTSRAMGVLGALSGLRSNGEEFPIEASISQIESNGRKLYTAIVRDVTERYRAEQALRDQTHVLDLAQVLVCDEEDRIVMWNRGAERLYGYALDEALGRTAHELLRTRFPEPIEQIKATLLRTGGWEGELIHKKKNGTQIAVASVWVLEPDAQNEGYRVLKADTDITGRKQAEDDLKLAQDRLVSALEGGGMGTWTWDMARKEISWDESMATLFGHSVNEIADGNLEPFFSWLHPDDREATRNALEAAVRDKTKYEIQYRLVRPDRKIAWITARGRLELDNRGNPRRMTGVCVDVTSQKMLQESLFQAQKMQALGTLAGGIAHDFNNIILAIGGNASLAIEDLAPEHPAMKSLREISKASARASNLVRRILAFSRRQSANRKILNLQPVVEEALGLLRSTLPARIEIRTNFADGLPPANADSTQIHQVIMNLGTNAARAIGDANGTMEVNAVLVKIDAEDPTPRHRLTAGHYVRVSMSDTGCGMDKATQERIFDPFFTTQVPGQGTGLGLSVVDGIMKDHEGSISLYSELGKGTVFHLYFPAVVTAERVALDTKESPLIPGNNESILYVDDEEALIRLASRAFKKLGYHVTAFAHPADALRAFRERPDDFDAVITDISMQGMSGLELAQQLRLTRPAVPIVLTSGYIRKEDQEAAGLLGIHELVLKPDTIDELVRALQRAMTKQAK